VERLTVKDDALALEYLLKEDQGWMRIRTAGATVADI
jgi:hypothetical protein